MLRELLDATLQPEAAPAWGLAGVVLTKTVDWLLTRRRSRVEALAQINNAQKNLNDGLFQQLQLLHEEVKTLREAHQACETKANEMLIRIQALESLGGQGRPH